VSAGIVMFPILCRHGWCGGNAGDGARNRCPRSSFTESVPRIPSGRRVTRRLRAAAGRAVALGAATVAQAARDFGLSWPVVHAAFLHYGHGGAAPGARTGGGAGSGSRSD
jgi:hypothetical protein